MIDNLQLGLDAQASHSLAVLRAHKSMNPLADKLSPVPGMFFSIDPEGRFEGTCRSGEDGLLKLDYTITKQPRWLALHIQLGGIDLGDAAILGVVCKSQAPEAITSRVCLRSGRPNGFSDAFLPKHVVSFAQESTHIDILRLDGRADVPAQAEWRELLLFFPTISASVNLRDFRLFIV